LQIKQLKEEKMMLQKEMVERVEQYEQIIGNKAS